MRMMVALLAKPFLDGIAPFQFSAGTLCGLIGVFWRLVISSMSPSLRHCPGLVYCGIFCTTSVMLQILGLGHSVPHWHGWYSAVVPFQIALT